MGLFKKSIDSRQRGRQRPGSTEITSSNPRYSYYQKRADIESEGVRRRREEYTETLKTNQNKFYKRLISNWVAILSTIVILASVLYMSTLSTSPNIKIIEEQSDGVKLLQDEQSYKEAATQILSDSILNRFKFFVDSNRLASQLQEQRPEISSVTVIIPIVGTSPTFVLRPIHPSFVLSSNQESYIINEFGVAAANIRDIDKLDQLNLVSVTDKSDLNIELGKPALSSEQTEFINTVIAQLKEKNIEIANFVVPVSAYDLELRLKGKPYNVRLNMLEDPRQQVGSFLVVQKEIEKGRIKVNDYIDVRVEERVYIR